MRNLEAARYASWAAMAAGLIALIVAVVYVERAVRQARARHNAPAMVSAGVQNKSTEFSFKQEVKGRTLFTVRASEETQFAERGRALLEDVWITVYGPQGDRNDNIHTRACSYEPETGAIGCAGDVEIDVQGQGAGALQAAGKTLAIKTRNISFNRNTGEASTPAPAEFQFPGAQGRGVGIEYSIRDSIVRVEHAVEFQMAPSPQTGGLPVRVTAGSLEIRRDDHIATLGGPVVVRQGDRQLAADNVSVELDQGFHARRVVADGHPVLQADEGGARISVAVGEVEALLTPAGQLEDIIGDRGVSGTRQSHAEVQHFSSARVEFAMVPEHDLVKEMTASGGVRADSAREGDSESLKTDALHLAFAPGKSADRQRIASAESLAPATIESRNGDEITDIEAKKFVAQMAPDGRIEKLLGHSGVQVRRETGKDAPQVLSAQELTASMSGSSAWETLDVTGGVRFQQDDRQVAAARARVVRATGMVDLAGAPVISDSASRTTAGAVTLNQQSGELRASGGVVSTYLPDSPGNAIRLGSGAAHISADALAGSTTAGHFVYAGHARLWQGDSVLDADQIEIWRDRNVLKATGRVTAAFSDASGSLPVPGAKSSRRSSNAGSASTVWQIRAPILSYSGDSGRAHLESGVVATSARGSLEAPQLDVFLAPAPVATPSGTSPAGARQMDRVLAYGGVVVHQADRRATADQAEYTSADGKFVLSGGNPTITDASNDTTTGHSLTFFVANDTILIDSQEGSRTLTKHRVEK